MAVYRIAMANGIGVVVEDGLCPFLVVAGIASIPVLELNGVGQNVHDALRAIGLNHTAGGIVTEAQPVKLFLSHLLMLFRFLFGAAGRHWAFQPIQNRRPRTLGYHRLLRRPAPAVYVQQSVQLCQAGRFDPQFFLIGGGLAHFLFGGCLLLVQVVQLGLGRLQPLGHLGKGIVDTGEIAAQVCAEDCQVGHLAFQQERIFLLSGGKFRRHGKAPVGATLHRLGAFDLLAGVQQQHLLSCPGQPNPQIDAGGGLSCPSFLV